MDKIKMMDNKLIRLSYLKEIKKNELVKNIVFAGTVGDFNNVCKEFKIDLIDNSSINIFVRVNKKSIDKIKSINYNKIVSS